MKSGLEGQETIIPKEFSEHSLNYGSEQPHGNNFCFIEPQDTIWAIKYSFVFCELISNRFFPLISFLAQQFKDPTMHLISSTLNTSTMCLKASYLFTGGSGQRSKFFNVLVCFFGKLVRILLLLLPKVRKHTLRPRNLFTAQLCCLIQLRLNSFRKITFLIDWLQIFSIKIKSSILSKYYTEVFLPTHAAGVTKLWEINTNSHLERKMIQANGRLWDVWCLQSGGCGSLLCAPHNWEVSWISKEDFLL